MPLHARQRPRRPMTCRRALRGHVYVNRQCWQSRHVGLPPGRGCLVARAVIVLADTVPEAFATRLRAKGAEVMRAGQDYDASMKAAEQAARDKGWTLLSDSSWPGYTDLPLRVMEGYLATGRRGAPPPPPPPTPPRPPPPHPPPPAEQIDQPPTHYSVCRPVSAGWPPRLLPMRGRSGGTARRLLWSNRMPPQP